MDFQTLADALKRTREATDITNLVPRAVGPTTGSIPQDMIGSLPAALMGLGPSGRAAPAAGGRMGYRDVFTGRYANPANDPGRQAYPAVAATQIAGALSPTGGPPSIASEPIQGSPEINRMPPAGQPEMPLWMQSGMQETPQAPNPFNVEPPRPEDALRELYRSGMSADTGKAASPGASSGKAARPKPKKKMAYKAPAKPEPGPFDFLHKLLPMEQGGVNPTGQPMLVGEDGPEVVVPSGPTAVIPNENLPNLAIRSGMQRTPPEQVDAFPAPPQSRADQAYQTSIDRWKNIFNNPGPAISNLGTTGQIIGTVMENADPERRLQRGLLPLNAPKTPKTVSEDDTIPALAQPAQGTQALDLQALMKQRESLNTQRQSLDAQRSTAVADRDMQLKGGIDKKTGKPIQAGRGPNYDAKEAEVARLTGEVGTIDGQIKNLDELIKNQTKIQSPEYQDMLSEGRKAAAVRDQMLTDRRHTYEELAPNWLKNAQAVLPFATGATVQGITALVQALKNRVGANRWWNAIEAANDAKTYTPTQRKGFARTSEGYEKEYPRPTVGSVLGSYGKNAALGGVEGFALSNLPEAYNSFLPAENQERLAYEEYLKRLPLDHPDRPRVEAIINNLPLENPARKSAMQHFSSGDWLTRGRVGALEGMSGALLGKTIGDLFGPTFPRPEAESLREGLSASLRKPRQSKPKTNPAPAPTPASAPTKPKRTRKTATTTP